MDTRPTVTHKQVMDEAQALINKKRRRWLSWNGRTGTYRLAGDNRLYIRR